MKEPNVNFHGVLAYSPETKVKMALRYMNQTQDDVSDIHAFGSGGVWGLIGPSGSMLFVEPQGEE